MAYCPECGNEVSVTDVRCSKCGHKLVPISSPEGIKNKIKGESNPAGKKRHNVEFALAIIAIVLSVFSISQSLNDYSFMNPSILILVLVIVLIGVIGAVLARYYAKPGTIIVLVTVFLLVLSGAQTMILAIIFAVAATIVAFVLN